MGRSRYFLDWERTVRPNSLSLTLFASFRPSPELTFIFIFPSQFPILQTSNPSTRLHPPINSRHPLLSSPTPLSLPSSLLPIQPLPSFSVLPFPIHHLPSSLFQPLQPQQQQTQTQSLPPPKHDQDGPLGRVSSRLRRRRKGNGRRGRWVVVAGTVGTGGEESKS